MCDRLRQCFEAKMTSQEIADEFGISRNAIVGKMNRLGLRRHAPGRHPRSNVCALNHAKRVSRPRPVLRIVKVEGPIAESRNLELDALETGDCRFPYGDGPFFFCGAPRVEKSSYCAHHHLLCWSRPNG